ncbi:MAG: CDP-alcohol phosphatidyltransferase family protein [Gemmatimonadetes bacterium]|nr:CDP-alcohol phosphatidyltransferase family protein [Gemmatimonadota bacterium]
MPEASPPPRGPQGRGASGLADAFTLARLPLAVAFVVVTDGRARLGILAAAAATDLVDGWVARRWGGSRFGAFLDPVADKIFMATAFAVVLFSGALAWWEIALVLLRDILATLAFIVSVVWRRPRSIPARVGGKIVTLLQLLTLLAFLTGSRYLEPFAWAAAAVGLYAIYDYARAIPTATRSVGA